MHDSSHPKSDKTMGIAAWVLNCTCRKYSSYRVASWALVTGLHLLLGSRKRPPPYLYLSWYSTVHQRAHCSPCPRHAPRYYDSAKIPGAGILAACLGKIEV